MAKEGCMAKNSIAGDNNMYILCQIAIVLLCLTQCWIGSYFITVGISGKTNVCIPSVAFLNGYDVPYTLNHLCSEVTVELYIRDIISP